MIPIQSEIDYAWKIDDIWYIDFTFRSGVNRFNFTTCQDVRFDEMFNPLDNTIDKAAADWVKSQRVRILTGDYAPKTGSFRYLGVQVQMFTGKAWSDFSFSKVEFI